MLRNSRLAENLLQGNQRDYWAEIKKIKSSNKVTSNNIDGITNDKNISDLFASKYSDLYNSVHCNDADMEGLKARINGIMVNSNVDVEQCNINLCDVQTAIKQLKKSKSDGLD